MKKILFTLLSMTMLTLTYGQEIEKDKDPLTSSTITINTDNVIALTGEHIIVEDRLDLEADSAQYDYDKKILTAFGMRRFTFKGKVVINEEDGIATFYLGGDSSSLAIIEE